LQVLHQVPDVDMAVGIRQSACDQDFSHIKISPLVGRFDVKNLVL
jgi:hypothetical protein